MCRYGCTFYKGKYACFDCQKSFRKENDRSIHKDHQVICPDCAKPMHNMGLDFKAPSKDDHKQWQKVKLLFENGIAFHSCGCCGPGERPRLLSEVAAFLKEREPSRKIGSPQDVIRQKKRLARKKLTTARKNARDAILNQLEIEKYEASLNLSQNEPNMMM